MATQLLDVPALAEYLDIPTATIYRWNHLGTGPTPYRVGRHVRYRPEEVERWLETRSGAQG